MLVPSLTLVELVGSNSRHVLQPGAQGMTREVRGQLLLVQTSTSQMEGLAEACWAPADGCASPEDGCISSGSNL